MRAQLVPLDGTPPIDLGKDLTLVGRRDECDLCLRHKSVSKMHCVIVKTDGLLLLRDLGSTNGTRVNGQRVRRAALLPNDQLTIAGFKFRVFFGPDDAVPPPPQDRTQQLDPKDVAKLLKKPDRETPPPDPVRAPEPSLHVNPLPDVYPDDESQPG
jgi:pSer/pThr/pTyr-binding forkhead associated (FHA) protein